MKNLKGFVQQMVKPKGPIEYMVYESFYYNVPTSRKLTTNQVEWCGETNRMREKGRGATPNEWKKCMIKSKSLMFCQLSTK